MTNKTISKILYLLLPLLLFSCVKDLETDYKGDRKVVVNCLLAKDSIQRLMLTFSNPLGDMNYDEVTDADISLFEADSLVGKFHKSSYGEWQLKFNPNYGQQYRLSIEVPGKPTIVASTTFPKPVPVYRNRSCDKFQNIAFNVGKSNTYWVFAFEKFHDTIMHPVIIDSRFKLIEILGTDNKNADHFNVLGDNDSDSGMHKIYIRMQKSDENSQYYLYRLYSCVVTFMSVSDEYDQYLKSSLKKMYVYESFDNPTQWFDESVVYSNITNGIGIFGAFHTTLINCNLQLPD